MKTEVFDLLTYVNADISFGGGRFRGGGSLLCDEVITLEETGRYGRSSCSVILEKTGRGWVGGVVWDPAASPRPSPGRTASVTATSLAGNELSGGGRRRRGG